MRRALLSLCLGAAACGGDDDAPPVEPAPSAQELLAPGPSPVGYRELELDYPDPMGSGTRTLPMRLWYPAVAGGEGAAEYAVAGIVELPSTSALASPALAPGGPFPLAIYSHGSGGEGLVGYRYGEHLASHGWVVIAPNHVGNTALDGIMMTQHPFARIALERPADITAILDWVEAGAGGDDVAAAGASDRVFLFGHSLGGYTTFAGGGVDLDFDAITCAAPCDPAIEAGIAAGFGDARVVAIAPQAPALVPAYVAGDLGALTVPALLMSGRRDITTTDAEEARPAWAGLDGPDDLWVEAPDGGHLSFLTICDDLDESILTAFQPENQQDGCGPDFTPSKELVPVFAAYLLGFARQHVLGDARWASILAGAPLHPALVVTVGH